MTGHFNEGTTKGSINTWKKFVLTKQMNRIVTSVLPIVLEKVLKWWYQQYIKYLLKKSDLAGRRYKETK